MAGLGYQKILLQQQENITALLTKVEFKTIHETIAKNFQVTLPAASNILAEKLIDVAKTNGQIALLDKLIEITGEVVKLISDKKIVEGLEVLFKYGLLLTVPLGVLKELNFYAETALSLDVRTEMAAETYLASLYGIEPKFKYEKDESGHVLDVTGQYGYHFRSEELLKQPDLSSQSEGTHIRESGWDCQFIADEVEKVVKTQVTGRYAIKLDEFDREELDQTLINERKKTFGNLHRVEANLRLNNKHPFSDEMVIKEIKSRLKELPIVIYGSKSGDNEAKISALVKSFYRLINN